MVSSDCFVVFVWEFPMWCYHILARSEDIVKNNFVLIYELLDGE